MALIRCKECGKEISENAKSCPNCGNPIKTEEKKKTNKKMYVTISIVIILILFVAITYKFLGANNIINRNEVIKNENEIVTEIKEEEITKDYIKDVMLNDDVDKGIELLKNNKEKFTNGEMTSIIGTYLPRKLYKDYSYKALYSSMKNPASLVIYGVNDYSAVLYYKSIDCYKNGSSGKLDEDYTMNYNKDFPIFHCEVKITYSGTNSYGGTMRENITYVYLGRLNEDFSLSDVDQKFAY